MVLTTRRKQMKGSRWRGICSTLVGGDGFNKKAEEKLFKWIFFKKYLNPSISFHLAFQQAVVNIIAKERPPFRYQTNPLYTPLVALKYADTSGELSVSAYYNLLFRFTRLFYISTSFLKCITCRCFRRQITPTWGQVENGLDGGVCSLLKCLAKPQQLTRFIYVYKRFY